MSRALSLALALLLGALLAACAEPGDDTASSASALSPAAYPGTPPEPAPLSALCSWPLVSDSDVLNVLLPDEAATYWVAALPNLPGTRLRIEGQYPQARYFSFNAYSPLLASVDVLTDYQIAPLQAGSNPYRDPAAAPGAGYVAYVLPEPAPAADQRQPNALYSGQFPVGLGIELPANPLQILIYRIYLAEGDTVGGVPLPTLTVETADGSQALMTLDLSICTPLVPPGLLPDLLSEAMRSQSPPAAVTALFSTVPLPVSSSTPTMQRSYGLLETFRSSMSDSLGFEIPGQAVTATVGANLANNLDNAYLQAILSRDKGSMYLVRGKAPKAATVPAQAPLGNAEVRYWSLCTNEVLSQRFTDCLYDAQVPLDADGYFTVLVSDPDQRPANAIAENGIGWLAWGALYPDATLLYRHMLPSVGYAEAIQNIPQGTPPETVMGSYYPLLAYCDRATVEAAGNSAAAVFAACAARSTDSPLP
ncbi:MAG: hypothetical protein Q8Q73_05780 [Stagnimonas sp.]|nr:hypothetical protein [Stagnimonas sp.]